MRTTLLNKHTENIAHMLKDRPIHLASKSGLSHYIIIIFHMVSVLLATACTTPTTAASFIFLWFFKHESLSGS